jgi:predicted  nucleic acid-binding Zn-ribbon protein
MDDELQALREELRDAYADIVRLTRELKNANARRAKTFDKLDQVKRSASGNDQALRAQVQALEEEVAQLRSEIARLSP